jgi:hypothetical protein
MALLKTRLSSDFDHNALQIHNQVDRVQWSGLPLDHLLNNRIGHLGNQRGKDVRTLQVLEGVDDLAGTHALRIQE